jgi:hypothetical protein
VFYDNKLNEQAETLRKDKAILQRQHNVDMSHLSSRNLRETQELRLYTENLEALVRELKDQYGGETLRYEEQRTETKRRHERQQAEWKEETENVIRRQKNLMELFRRKVEKLKKRLAVLEQGGGGSQVSSSSPGGENVPMEVLDESEDYIFDWMEMPAGAQGPA